MPAKNGPPHPSRDGLLNKSLIDVLLRLEAKPMSIIVVKIMTQ
jgi:hypothetical protein